MQLAKTIPTTLLLLACGSGASTSEPPLLPRDGWFEEVEQAWLEQSSPLPISMLNSAWVERREGFFAMDWGGNGKFSSGECTVDSDLWFDCGAGSYLGDGGEGRTGVTTSTLTGVLLDASTMEVEHTVVITCEGSGCEEDILRSGTQWGVLRFADW